MSRDLIGELADDVASSPWSTGLWRMIINSHDIGLYYANPSCWVRVRLLFRITEEHWPFDRPADNRFEMPGLTT
jgi:hypothetical protein